MWEIAYFIYLFKEINFSLLKLFPPSHDIDVTYIFVISIFLKDEGTRHLTFNLWPIHATPLKLP